MRARSMAFLAPSLVMILARWHSIVRGLIPTFRAASLFDAAVMSSVRTAASRRQRVTAGSLADQNSYCFQSSEGASKHR